MAPKKTSSGLKMVAGVTAGPSSSSSSSRPVQDSKKEELIQALAVAFPSQEATIPSPASTRDLVQKLEDAAHQIISIIGSGQGTYADFETFINNGLKAVRYTGDTSLAEHCEQKFVHLKDALYSLEGLISVDPCEGMGRFLARARMRGAVEREARQREIQERETFYGYMLTRQIFLQGDMDASNSLLGHLRTQLTLLRAAMDVPASVIARLKASIVEEMLVLEDLLVRGAEAYSDLSEATGALEESRHHDAVETASFEARIQEKIRAGREMAIADVQAELASFNLK